MNKNIQGDFQTCTSVFLKNLLYPFLFRNSRPEVSCKKGVLRNFAKHLRCFPVNFVKFLRTLFLIEHIRWLLLFIDGTTPLHNFEFRKKKVLLLTKNFFSRSFQSSKFFHERVSCVKNGT